MGDPLEQHSMTAKTFEEISQGDIVLTMYHGIGGVVSRRGLCVMVKVKDFNNELPFASEELVMIVKRGARASD